jgi:flagellar protein FlaF
MHGYGAYRKVANQTESTRSIEFRLFGEITAELIAARDNPQQFELKTAAVLRNRKLWAALREDLTDTGNALPKQVRANLISLSLWVEKESFAVLDKKSDLEALIEVNKQIMEGLQPREAAAQAVPAAQAQAPAVNAMRLRL